MMPQMQFVEGPFSYNVCAGNGGFLGRKTKRSPPLGVVVDGSVTS